MHFRNQDKLRETIEHYDIRNSQCSAPADREILLNFVSELFYTSNSSSASISQDGFREGGNSTGAHGADARARSVSSEEINGNNHGGSDVVDGGSGNEPSGIDAGLEAFNHAVRTEVPRHGVSINGIRQCKIFSYTTAVLVPLQYIIATMNNDLFFLYDRWAFSFPVRDNEEVNFQWDVDYEGYIMKGWSQGVEEKNNKLNFII